MVLVATGWSLLLLLFFYFIVDVCQVRQPFHLFRVIGLNSIFAYVIWSVFGNRILPRVFTIIFARIVPDAELLAQCMISICSFALFWCILYCLYKKEIFIKI
jgi:predicted acyltransferase